MVSVQQASVLEAYDRFKNQHFHHETALAAPCKPVIQRLILYIVHFPYGITCTLRGNGKFEGRLKRLGKES